MIAARLNDFGSAAGDPGTGSRLTLGPDCVASTLITSLHVQTGELTNLRPLRWELSRSRQRGPITFGMTLKRLPASLEAGSLKARVSRRFPR